MTPDLFRANPDLTECRTAVTFITSLELVLERTMFDPLGGGQAGGNCVLVLGFAP
jgi:misacylated tRNA(Ala) deacylase